jgi:hypothetical protein
MRIVSVSVSAYLLKAQSDLDLGLALVHPIPEPLLDVGKPATDAATVHVKSRRRRGDVVFGIEDGPQRPPAPQTATALAIKRREVAVDENVRQRRVLQQGRL